MRSKKEYPYVDEIDGVEVVYFSEDFIVGRWVTTTWTSNKNYYIPLGYNYTGHLEKFEVDVRHLKKNSAIFVNAFCNFCKDFRNSRLFSLNKAGHTKCIGCNQINDETGNRYKKLIVIRFSHIDKHRSAHWKCLCDCGNETIVCGRSLRRKLTRSCGCLQLETWVAIRKVGADNPSYGKKGSLSPVWNHNLTDEERAKKRTNQGYIFSVPVFKRDNFICQISGKYGGGRKDLEAHHLEGRSTNKQLAFDINNGITTIRQYHREFHKWLGGTRIPCTKQDMINFCELFYPDAPFLRSI